MRALVILEIENKDSCEGCSCLVSNREETYCPEFIGENIFSMKRPNACKARSENGILRTAMQVIHQLSRG